MRPRLGGGVALGLLLDHVVADRRRRAQPLLDVARLEVLLVEVAVDAGEAVGLQLQPHGAALRALPVLPDLLVEARQVLHVVPVLVRDDVRLGEGAALRAEPAPQLVEEPEIQVDEAIAGQRAIERSANVEATNHLIRGLEILTTLADTPSRAQQELAFEK